ncbi:MAG: hypothetical protein GY856_02550 [bacterium]|nr:hypothetical protein [bacterium]
MKDQGPSFRESLEALARKKAPSGPHPSAEELSAYRSGQLSEGDESRLLGHLVGCRDCVDQLLLLEPWAGSEASGEDSDKLVDFEAFLAWREMQARIREMELRQRVRRWRIPAAMAASLLVAALGVSGTMAVQNRALVAELTRPQPNAPVEDLRTNRGRSGGTSAPTTVEVPAEANSFTLILSVAQEYPDYEVQILDSAGREVFWSSREVEIDSWGAGTLGLSRHFLEAGAYRVRLWGLGGDQPELIEDYPLEIRIL